VTAPTPAEVAKGLRELADRVEITGLLPSPSWPLTFRTPADVCTPAGVEAAARSLGVQDGTMQGAEEEDGYFWYRLRGHAGAVVVDVTTEGGPVLPGPLTDRDPSLIHRTYPAGVAL
jgi:hypothetical protein